MREAEEQKFLAEQRAAEAEKRLIEKENQTEKEIETLETSKFPKNSVQDRNLRKLKIKRLKKTFGRKHLTKKKRFLKKFCLKKFLIKKRKTHRKKFKHYFPNRKSKINLQKYWQSPRLAY